MKITFRSAGAGLDGPHRGAHAEALSAAAPQRALACRGSSRHARDHGRRGPHLSGAGAGRRHSVLVRAWPRLALAAPAPAQATSQRPRGRRGRARAARSGSADGRGVRTGRELTRGARRAVPRAARRSAPPTARRPTSCSRGPADPATRSPGAHTTRRDDRYALLGELLRALGRARRRRTAARQRPTPAPTPDYIDVMLATFEQSFEVENGELGWRDAGAPTAALGGDARTDVYVKDLNDDDISAACSATRARPPARAATPARLPGDRQRLLRRRVPRYVGDLAAAAAGHGRARVQPRAPVRLRRLPGPVDVRVDGDVDGGEGLPRRQRLSSTT